jgi:hypothetical protein
MKRDRKIGLLAGGILFFLAVVLYSCGGGGSYGGGGGMVAVAPGAFSLSSPPDGAAGVGTTPTLQWMPAAYVADYRVQIDTVGTFSGALVINTTVSAMTHGYPVPAATLSPGTTYFWRVLAENIYGQAVAGPRSFTP